MKKYSLFLLHLTCLSEEICTVKLTVMMGKVHNSTFKGLHAERETSTKRRGSYQIFKLSLNLKEICKIFNNRKSSINNKNLIRYIDIKERIYFLQSPDNSTIFSLLKWNYFLYSSTLQIMPNPHIATIYCMLFANYIQHQFFYIAIQDCTANLGSNTWKKISILYE